MIAAAWEPCARKSSTLDFGGSRTIGAFLGLAVLFWGSRTTGAFLMVRFDIGFPRTLDCADKTLFHGTGSGGGTALEIARCRLAG